eukprot:Rmarinus@m.9219
MFEGVLSDVLCKYLGNYVKGIDKKSLSLSAWKGDVSLENLDLREDALEQLNLPVHVVAGHMGRLKVIVPWKKLKSKPTVIQIDDIYLLAKPNDSFVYNREKEEELAWATKQRQLDELEKVRASGPTAKESTRNENSDADAKKPSFVKRLAERVINNIQVKVQRVHLRYEDNASFPTRPFAMGFTLSSLTIESTDETWQKTFLRESVTIAHKLLQVSQLSLYVETDLVPGASLLPRTVSPQAWREKFFGGLDSLASRRYYVLRPLDVDVRLALNMVPANLSHPHAVINMEIPKISLELSEDQYLSLLKLLEHLSFLERRKRYRSFERPTTRPKQDPRGWWKYVARCVRFDSHERLFASSWQYLAQRRADRLAYMQCYREAVLVGKKQWFGRGSVHRGASEELLELERRLAVHDIVLFRTLSETAVAREETVRALGAEVHNSSSVKRGLGVSLKLKSPKENKDARRSSSSPQTSKETTSKPMSAAPGEVTDDTNEFEEISGARSAHPKDKKRRSFFGKLSHRLSHRKSKEHSSLRRSSDSVSPSVSASSSRSVSPSKSTEVAEAPVASHTTTKGPNTKGSEHQQGLSHGKHMSSESPLSVEVASRDPAVSHAAGSAQASGEKRDGWTKRVKQKLSYHRRPHRSAEQRLEKLVGAEGVQKLYDELDIDTSAPQSDLPKTYVQVVLGVRLTCLEAVLRESHPPRSSSPGANMPEPESAAITTVLLQRVFLSLKALPQGKNVQASVGSLKAVDNYSSKKEIVLSHSLQGTHAVAGGCSEGDVFLCANVDINPPAVETPLTQVVVRGAPIDVVVAKRVTDRILCFFRDARASADVNTADFGAVQDAKARARYRAQAALRQRKRFCADVELYAPNVFVPSESEGPLNESSGVAVALGRFNFNTVSHNTDSGVEHSGTNEYDAFDLKLTDIQAVVYEKGVTPQSRLAQDAVGGDAHTLLDDGAEGPTRDRKYSSSPKTASWGGWLFKKVSVCGILEKATVEDSASPKLKGNLNVSRLDFGITDTDAQIVARVLEGVLGSSPGDAMVAYSHVWEDARMRGPLFLQTKSGAPGSVKKAWKQQAAALGPRSLYCFDEEGGRGRCTVIPLRTGCVVRSLKPSSATELCEGFSPAGAFEIIDPAKRLVTVLRASSDLEASKWINSLRLEIPSLTTSSALTETVALYTTADVKPVKEALKADVHLSVEGVSLTLVDSVKVDNVKVKQPIISCRLAGVSVALQAGTYKTNAILSIASLRVLDFCVSGPGQASHAPKSKFFRMISSGTKHNHGSKSKKSKSKSKHSQAEESDASLFEEVSISRHGSFSSLNTLDSSDLHDGPGHGQSFMTAILTIAKPGAPEYKGIGKDLDVVCDDIHVNLNQCILAALVGFVENLKLRSEAKSKPIAETQPVAATTDDSASDINEFASFAPMLPVTQPASVGSTPIEMRITVLLPQVEVAINEEFAQRRVALLKLKTLKLQLDKLKGGATEFNILLQSFVMKDASHRPLHRILLSGGGVDGGRHAPSECPVSAPDPGDEHTAAVVLSLKTLPTGLVRARVEGEIRHLRAVLLGSVLERLKQVSEVSPLAHALRVRKERTLANATAAPKQPPGQISWVEIRLNMHHAAVVAPRRSTLPAQIVLEIESITVSNEFATTDSGISIDQVSVNLTAIRAYAATLLRRRSGVHYVDTGEELEAMLHPTGFSLSLSRALADPLALRQSLESGETPPPRIEIFVAQTSPLLVSIAHVHHVLLLGIVSENLKEVPEEDALQPQWRSSPTKSLPLSSGTSRRYLDECDPLDVKLTCKIQHVAVELLAALTEDKDKESSLERVLSLSLSQLDLRLVQTLARQQSIFLRVRRIHGIDPFSRAANEIRTVLATVPPLSRTLPPEGTPPATLPQSPKIEMENEGDFDDSSAGEPFLMLRVRGGAVPAQKMQVRVNVARLAVVFVPDVLARVSLFFKQPRPHIVPQRTATLEDSGPRYVNSDILCHEDLVVSRRQHLVVMKKGSVGSAEVTIDGMGHNLILAESGVDDEQPVIFVAASMTLYLQNFTIEIGERSFSEVVHLADGARVEFLDNVSYGVQTLAALAVDEDARSRASSVVQGMQPRPKPVRPINVDIVVRSIEVYAPLDACSDTGRALLYSASADLKVSRDSNTQHASGGVSNMRIIALTPKSVSSLIEEGANLPARESMLHKEIIMQESFLLMKVQVGPEKPHFEISREVKNVALRKNVYADVNPRDDNFHLYGPHRVVDGKLSDGHFTAWVKEGNITIDLEGLFEVETVIVHWSGRWGAATKLWRVELSNDGEKSFTVIREETNAARKVDRVDCVNVPRTPQGSRATATHVRLYFSNPASGSSIHQIQVMGIQVGDVVEDCTDTKFTMYRHGDMVLSPLALALPASDACALAALGKRFMLMKTELGGDRKDASAATPQDASPDVVSAGDTCVKKTEERVSSVLFLKNSGMSIGIVDDFGGRLVPFLQARVPAFEARVAQTMPRTLSLKTEISFEMDFFNLEVAQWEPVVEPWSAVATLNKAPDPIGGKPCVDIDLVSYDRFDVNLSHIFLSSAIGVAAGWKDGMIASMGGGADLTARRKPALESQAVQASRTFSPFVIRNETGAKITVFSRLSRSGADDSSSAEESVTHTVDTAETWLVDSDSSNLQGVATGLSNAQSRCQKQIALSIEALQTGHGVCYVENVPLEKVGIHVFPVILSARQKRQKMLEDGNGDNAVGTSSAVAIVTDTVLQGGQKITTVRSAFTLQNSLAVTLLVAVCRDNGTVLIRGSVSPGEKLFLPVMDYDSTKGRVRVRPAEMPYTWSGEADKSIWLYDPTRLVTDLVCPSSVHDHEDPFFRILVEKVAEEDGRVHTWNMRPPLLFTNLLPTAISHRMSCVGTDGRGDEIQLGSGAIASGSFVHYHAVREGVRCLLRVALTGGVWQLQRPVCVYSGDGTDGEEVLQLIDDHDRTLTLTIEYIRLPGGCLSATLYCPFWIVNKTGLPVIVAEARNIRDNIVAAGTCEHSRVSTEPFLFNFESSFESFRKCSLQVHDSEWCSPFSVEVAGSNFSVEVDESSIGASRHRQPRRCFELGLNVSVAKGDFWRSKIVTIYPRFVVHNGMGMPIQLRQVDQTSTVRPTVLNPGEHSPFHWPEFDKKKLLQVRPAGDIWEYSTGIDATTIGEFCVKVHPVEGIRNGPPTEIVHVAVSVVEATAHVVFTAADPSNSPYRIENISWATLRFCQTGFENHSSELLPYGSCGFAWDNPFGQRTLTVHLATKSGSSSAEFSLDELNNDGTISIGDTGVFSKGPVQKFYVGVSADGPTRVLRVCEDKALLIQGSAMEEDFGMLSPKVSVSDAGNDATDSSETKTIGPRQAYSMKLSAKFSGLAFSVINKEPRELLYIIFDVIDVKLGITPATREFELTIRRVQIDNQLVDASMPVLLIIEDVATKRDHVHCSIVQSTRYPTVSFFEYCSVLVQAMKVSLDDTILLHLVDFGTSLKKTALKYGSLASKPAESLEHENRPSGDAKKVYFEILQLHPLKFTLSFSVKSEQKLSGGGKTVNPANALLDMIGVSLSNIDEAPVGLNALVLEHPFESKAALQKRVLKHYERQALFEVHKIAGSAELLGNPVGLMSNVGTGVIDFFYEPAQGITKSPADFGAGLAKGSISLVKNTVYGLFNATGKLTEAVGKGLATLSMDDDYLRRRNRERVKRPRHAGEGLVDGAEALGKGVFQGITGIITKPLSGARQEGVSGFVKGVGRGIAGVVVKPVTGVMDFATQVTQGIRNTTTIWDPQRPRIRNPRVIGTDRVLHPFNKSAAWGQWILTTVNKGKRMGDRYFTHFQAEGGFRVVIVTNRRILFCRPKELTESWHVSYRKLAFIQPMEREEKGVVRYGVDVHERLRDGLYPRHVDFESHADSKDLVKAVQEAVRMFRIARGVLTDDVVSFDDPEGAASSDEENGSNADGEGDGGAASVGGNEFSMAPTGTQLSHVVENPIPPMGILEKSDDVLGIAWTPLLFVLEGERLCWYEIESRNAAGRIVEYEPESSMDVAAIVRVEEVSPDAVGKENAFCIHADGSADSRSMTVASTTLEERALWVRELRNAMTRAEAAADAQLLPSEAQHRLNSLRSALEPARSASLETTSSSWLEDGEFDVSGESDLPSGETAKRGILSDEHSEGRERWLRQCAPMATPPFMHRLETIRFPSPHTQLTSWYGSRKTVIPRWYCVKEGSLPSVRHIVYAIVHVPTGWFSERRYKDFVSLRDSLLQLEESSRGNRNNGRKLGPKRTISSIHMPGKAIFGTNNPEFIDQRRVGLEKFLGELIDAVGGLSGRTDSPFRFIVRKFLGAPK